MAKDSKQTDIKAGDKVTLSGIVVDACAADTAPCQVRLNGPDGYCPIVSLASPLLTVMDSSPQKVDPPKVDTIKQTVSLSQPATDKPVTATK